jgi:hypothetical protein
MLNNPNWSKDVVDWMRRQPADADYDWQHPDRCIVGRFLAAKGLARQAVDYAEMPHYHEITEPKPWTFGAALKRAENTGA